MAGKKLQYLSVLVFFASSCSTGLNAAFGDLGAPRRAAPVPPGAMRPVPQPPVTGAPPVSRASKPAVNRSNRPLPAPVPAAAPRGGEQVPSDLLQQASAALSKLAEELGYMDPITADNFQNFMDQFAYHVQQDQTWLSRTSTPGVFEYREPNLYYYTNGTWYNLNDLIKR